MSPVPDAAIVFLATTSCLVWNRTAESPRWASHETIAIPSLVTADAPRETNPLQATAILREALDAFPAGTPPRLVIVLASDLCPGLVVNLGDRPLRRQVRENLAKHRLQETFGITASDWAIAIDGNKIVGEALAVGVNRAVLAEIAALARARSARVLSIVPETIWALRAQPRSEPEYWLCVDGVHTTTCLHIKRAGLRNLDQFSTIEATEAEVVRLISVCGMRHGLDTATVPIGVVSWRRRFASSRRRVGERWFHAIDPFSSPDQSVDFPPIKVGS